MSNPFAPGVPAQQAPPQGGNPFAPAQPAAPAPPQPAPAPAPAPQPVAGNPFVPNPAYPAPAPVQQYAPPAAPATSYGTGPHAQTVPQQQAPPALDVSGLQAAPAPVVGEGRGAKLADMYGRLVLVFPLALTRVPRNPRYITAEQRQQGNLDQDRMTVTVVVLDDGVGGMQPIAFGGAPYALPPTAHTDSAPLPYIRKGMWINQSRLISQFRDALPQPGQVQQMRVGRVVKAGPEGNDPWYLQAPTDQDLQLAGAYLSLVQRGEYPHPLA